MTRFEIQDIARQNMDGVTFRALDKSTDQIVSLRRFFPFGQDEEGAEGLDPQEGKAFSSACEKLGTVQHPALRKTIFGDTDPVDGMPFLVTEWIDGESLSNVLGSNTMPADMTIALVQQVFDVCNLLSETLQSEAIWIDTSPQSIIVCNPSENPTFSFRICPFKWLGTSKLHLKDMSSIVSLIEELMGWKSKLVSDQAGKGLGGYIKLLRQYPEMEISKAVQSLPNHSYEVVEVVTETTKTPTTLFPPIPTANASFFNKKSITVMSVSACFTGALIFFLYQQQTKQIDQNITVPSELYDPTDNPEIVSNPERVTPETEPPVTTPDTTETDSDNKTATNTTVPPTDPTDTTPTEKDPKETETSAATTKTTPEGTVQTDKTLASTTWSPISIPSVVWYDASTASIEDGTVTIANAGSDGGTISGPASLVGNGIGNLQAVQFTPNNTYLTGDYINTGKTLTAFFVGKSLNASQTAYAGMMCIWQDRMPNDYDNIGSTVLFNQDNLKANTVQTYRLSKKLSTSTGNLTAGFIVGTVFNGTTNTSYLNGNAATSINSVGNFNTNKIVLGARWHSLSHKYSWNGNFGEAIIFNTELSESDRQKIEGYLAHKWGLAGNLPADHPYKTSAPDSSSKLETLVNLPKNETIIEKVKPTPSVGRLWSPDEISTAAWYDAADASTITSSSGGAVSQWNDKSGGKRHAIQGTETDRPTTGIRKLNGLNVVDFSRDYLVSPLNIDRSETDKLSVFTVFACDEIVGSYALFGADKGGWGRFALLNFDDNKVAEWGISNGSGTTPFAASRTPDTASHILSINLHTSASNGSLVALDGDKVTVFTESRSKANYTTTAIGAISQTGSNAHDGYIAEQIYITDLTSTAERQKIEGYLAHKWSLTGNLPANHPYKSSAPIPSILTSRDTETIKTLKVGDPVTLQGIVKSAKFSSTGKSIYLSFSDPDVETDIRVVIHGNEYEGNAFTEDEFAKLIGKNLVFSGTVYRETFNDRPPFVKITEKKQIKLAKNPAVEKQPISEDTSQTAPPETVTPRLTTAKGTPIFSPDEVEAIAKLESNKPAAVRGVVKSVKIPRPGTGLYFNFSDPLDVNQIRALIYQKTFEGGPYTDKRFKEIEQEYQKLVGKTVIFEGIVHRHKDKVEPHFILITQRDQIKLEE